MSVRLNILENLYSGLQNIRTENNFNTDLGKNVLYTIRNSTTIKNFPCTQIEIINTVPVDTDESNTLIRMNTSIGILIDVKAEDQIELENLISDIKLFLNFQTDDSDFDVSKFCSLGSVKYVSSYYLDSIQPVYTSNSNVHYVKFIIQVKHYEVVNEY